METEKTIVPGGFNSPAFFCAQTTGGDVENLWPPFTTIRARCSNSVHESVKRILKSTLADWLWPNFNLCINVVWVEEGDADVRFNMSSGVTWCVLGYHAHSIPQSEPTATLGLRKWKKVTGAEKFDEEVVWTVEEIERIARHVWGHVLGLPHAYMNKRDWDSVKVSQLCYDNHLQSTRIFNLKGHSKLRSIDSIMHIDQSEDWSTTVNLRSSNVLVDSESGDLLSELYDTPPVVDIVEESIRNFPGWKKDTPINSGSLFIDTKVVLKTDRQRIVSAITHFELGNNPRYQAHVGWVAGGPGINLNVGAFGPGHQFNELKGIWACFDSSDDRTQSGWETMANIRLKGAPGPIAAAAPNEVLDKQCTFRTPFKAPPNVIVFIFRFSSQYTDSNRCLRITASVVTTSTTGFTIRVNAFGGNMVDDIGAMWIAHDVNDETIRSDRHDATEKTVSERSISLTFSKPFPTKPRFLFYGFHHLDVSVNQGACANVSCEATNWDKDDANITIRTPGANHRAGVSYIALL